MRYKKLGNTGMDVSVVGLGTWAYGNDYFGTVDDNQSIDAIRASIEAGVNLIDTAPAYGAGHAEIVVGKAIANMRDRVIISTKCGTIRKSGQFLRDLRPESIRKELDESLRRLNVDYIDIYLLHWPDANTPLEATIEEIARLKETGKFRHFGVSNFDLEQIDLISKVVPVEVIQPHYSILFRSKKELISACAKREIGVMTYGSLAGGMLTGKYREKPVFSGSDTRSNMYTFFKEPLWSKSRALVDELEHMAKERGRLVSELAINYVTCDNDVASALVGAKTRKQALANADSTSWTLTAKERNRIDSTYHKLFG